MMRPRKFGAKLSGALSSLKLERPCKRPTRWARVGMMPGGALRIGGVHSDYRCDQLHHDHGSSSTMIIPIDGPLVRFLGECEMCAKRQAIGKAAA